jgi:acetyl coenzyme A synthetase (ADP forming)-like protein
MRDALSEAPRSPVPAPPSPSAYPVHRAGDVVLRDGSTVHVRPVRSADREGLLAFLRGLSESSRVFRFFAQTTETFLEKEAARVSDVDYTTLYSIVATTGERQRIVAHAMYGETRPRHAEVAFAVADDFQGRGLGTILLGHLAEVAEANGYDVFEAEVLAANHQMINVFRESGFPTEVKARSGELLVTFPTSFTDEARERFEQRDRIASVNALQGFFYPKSIAVIGASRERGSIGGEIFHNLLTFGFEGPVYPVNPKADVVQCVPAYPSIEAVPGPVDLAILVVPAAHVTAVAEACGRKGVRAIVVISAGFGETGADGRARQADLVRVCRAAGMRLIGPNCMGIANTDPAVRMNATFSPQAPPEGKIGFSSQSGALGLAIIDYANAMGLGISTFVSIGNKADISGNDLIRFWEADPRTSVILLYLESFGNPRKFSQIARRVGRSKPIAVVKSGRSQAGARATSSHTGALLAASDITIDALFRQTGVIRTDTLEELFDVATLLAHQPLPKGRRVAIVTNAGGPGILCADACEAEGLQIPVLADETQRALRAFLPATAATTNPVDMIASAPPEHFRRTIDAVARDPNVDALVIIYIPPLVTKPDDVAAAIAAAVDGAPADKTLMTVFMSSKGVPETLRRREPRVPNFEFPEAAAIALSRIARYAEWRARPATAPKALSDARTDEAAALVAAALHRGAGWLTPAEVDALLDCYGVPRVRQRIAATPDEAGEAAAALGGRIALKAIAPNLVHKTEAGAVRLGLSDAETVRACAAEMIDRLRPLGHEPTGFVVQQMAPAGVEMIVGVVGDPQFGPVVACGAGGVMVELLKDVSVRLAPLTQEDAVEMIRDLKTYPLLTGFRGTAPADVAALEEALLRISAMVDDLPQIAELDCNPIVAHPGGAVVVDARVRVAPAEPPAPLGTKR